MIPIKPVYIDLAAAIRRRERIRGLFGLSYVHLAADCARAYRATRRGRLAAAAVLCVAAAAAAVVANVAVVAVAWGAYTGHAVPGWVAVLVAALVVLGGSTIGAELLSATRRTVAAAAAAGPRAGTPAPVNGTRPATDGWDGADGR